VLLLEKDKEAGASLDDEHMPRKRNLKSVKPATPESAVPDYIQQAPLLSRRKITKRKLPTFTEAMLLLHAPEAIRLYWEALLIGLKERDKSALEAVGEIFNYVKGRGGPLVSVTQQMLQQNTVAGPDSPVIGFDAFARQLAEARAGHALPPPEDDVIDIQPVRPADGVPGA
jgi:hypothetical protein